MTFAIEEFWCKVLRGTTHRSGREVIANASARSWHGIVSCHKQRRFLMVHSASRVNHAIHIINTSMYKYMHTHAYIYIYTYKTFENRSNQNYPKKSHHKGLLMRLTSENFSWQICQKYQIQDCISLTFTMHIDNFLYTSSSWPMLRNVAEAQRRPAFFRKSEIRKLCLTDGCWIYWMEKRDICNRGKNISE